MPRVAKKTQPNRPTETNEEAPRARRPKERTPVSGSRDLLTVRGKREDLEYRWVRDVSETGHRIFIFNEAGWFFVPAGDVRVGQSQVYETSDHGSIVRVPDGGGSYLYLMAIEKEFYDEDQMAKHKELLDEERNITRPRDAEEDDGQYGTNKIGFDLR